MWAQLQRFKNLEAPAQGLFLRAWIMLPLVAASLRMRGFGATQRSLQRSILNATRSAVQGPSGELAAVDDSRVPLIARMVAAAARRSALQADCLERSLTLWWLLGRQGIASQLRIGTRKAGDRLDAHAWVEYRGKSLNEIDDVHQRYAAFDEAFSGVERTKK